MNRPDSRGWASIGFAVLFLVVFLVRSAVPELRSDAVTGTILTDLERGAVLLAAAFYFAASKSDKTPP